MSENNKVVKGNGLTFRTRDIIEARYSLKGKEEDVFDMVLSKLEYDKNLRYCIEVKEFKKYYINNANIYREIKKTVKNMEGVGVHIYDEETEIETFYPWFSKIRYIDNEGWIEVDIHPEMKEILLEAKKKIYIEMKYKFRLSNEYSKRRYEMIKSFQHSGWRIDTVEELGRKLKVPKSYSEKYSLFKKNVIKKTEDEINAFTDFKIVSIEEKERNKVVRIKTIITKKTEEELKKTEEALEMQYKKNYINSNEISITEPVRIQIEKAIKNIDTIDLDVKKKLAEYFNLSVKSIERYILINTKLIKELKELLDLNFLSISTCCKYAKDLNQDQQLKEYNSIKRRVNKFKIKLIPQLSEALDHFKITYIQAEKYSKKNEEEQLKFYERKLGEKKGKKKKNTPKEDKAKVIDVEYEEIEKDNCINDEISVDISVDNEEIKIDSNKEFINDIEKVKEILKDINISDEEAKTIYINSNKDLDYIEYIYCELSQQKSEIRNAVAWIKEMVKPNVYKKPITIKNNKASKQLRFNNFKGRDYDYDDLEKKLLGWDKEDEEDVEEDVEEDNSNEVNIENEVGNITVESVKTVLSMLKGLIKKEAYKCWIEAGIIDIKIDKDIMIIICINNLTKGQLEGKYNSFINEIIKSAYTEIKTIKYEIKSI